MKGKLDWKNIIRECSLHWDQRFSFLLKLGTTPQGQLGHKGLAYLGQSVFVHVVLLHDVLQSKVDLFLELLHFAGLHQPGPIWAAQKRTPLRFSHVLWISTWHDHVSCLTSVKAQVTSCFLITDLWKWVRLLRTERSPPLLAAGSINSWQSQTQHSLIHHNLGWKDHRHQWKQALLHLFYLNVFR